MQASNLIEFSEENGETAREIQISYRFKCSELDLNPCNCKTASSLFDLLQRIYEQMLILIQFRTRDCKTSTAEIQNLEIVSFLLWIGSKEEEKTRSEGSN